MTGRLAVIYLVALGVGLIAKFERVRWQAVLDEERQLPRERVELSEKSTSRRFRPQKWPAWGSTEPRCWPARRTRIWRQLWMRPPNRLSRPRLRLR